MKTLSPASRAQAKGAKATKQGLRSPNSPYESQIGFIGLLGFPSQGSNSLYIIWAHICPTHGLSKCQKTACAPLAGCGARCRGCGPGASQTLLGVGEDISWRSMVRIARTPRIHNSSYIYIYTYVYICVCI